MNIIVGSFIFLLVLSIGLIVPILIGVYVYRDANRRGMNALMWTLIALFAPSLIGFIIYLLVRSSYSDLECPKCGTTTSRLISSRGVAHLGHTVQSGSTGAEQFGQNGRSLAPHFGQRTYSSLMAV